MAWFAYGYFVRLPDRSIVPAGHDFGPTLDSYAVGDSLGVKGDSKGFVIGILKGSSSMTLPHPPRNRCNFPHRRCWEFSALARSPRLRVQAVFAGPAGKLKSVSQPGFSHDMPRVRGVFLDFLSQLFYHYA
jgi:hypothetical protein